jgi:UDP:flavonoid glycosyltransferase YjiC (YdhE family)
VFSKRLESGELPSALRWPNERPRLLAYLSASDLDYPRMLDDLEEVCERVGGCGIFMLGGQDYLKATPVEHGRVRVVDEAPAVALLRGADLAITHGGLNSILQALRCGVPLLGVPLDSAERQANVRRAVHLGVALTTGEEVPDGPSIARLASTLCSEQSFKQAARQVGGLIDRAPGAKGVVAVAANLVHAAAKG